MLITYYMMSPSDSLLNRARGVALDWTELVTERTVWSKREGDRTALSESDRVSLVKHLFLMTIGEYRDLPHFDTVVGAFKQDVEFFDANWLVEEINEVEDFDDIASRLAESHLMSGVRTGNVLVDECLRSYMCRTEF